MGKAVIHIGDEGKFGSVKASFYPGNPPINYHSKRLDELKEIGYDVPKKYLIPLDSVDSSNEKQ